MGVDRRNRGMICVGDRLWLVPRTAGAPAAAYHQPPHLVTVVRVDLPFGQVTVRLPRRRGQHLHGEITVSRANLSASRPPDRAQPRPRPQQRPGLELGAGEQEVPLW